MKRQSSGFFGGVVQDGAGDVLNGVQDRLGICLAGRPREGRVNRADTR